MTLGPVGAGELVQEGAVRVDLDGSASTGTDEATGPEFSFPVDRERALAGDVRPGEEVDLLATFGSGSDATTEVLARRARVLHVQEARTGTLGSSGRLVLTVGLASDAEVVDVAHASEVAVITLVRPSGKGVAVMTSEHYVVLGAARPRAAWFADVGRWATSAALPVEFVRLRLGRRGEGPPGGRALVVGRGHRRGLQRPRPRPARRGPPGRVRADRGHQRHRTSPLDRPRAPWPCSPNRSTATRSSPCCASTPAPSSGPPATCST